MAMSNYVHSIPGRLRVKTALIKKNSGEAEKVERLLKSIPGVQSLGINLVTGSVLVRYDPDNIGADQLLQTLTEAGYFEPSKAITHDEVVHSTLTRGGKAIGALVFGALEIENPALAILTALI
jgi:copper chaperone CopZ